MRKTLLELIGHDTQLRRVSTSVKRGSAEYAGACPFCGGTDRFRVWPDQERPADAPDCGPGYWECMRGHCGRKGDAIQYVQYRDNVRFHQACRELGILPGDYHPPAEYTPAIPCLDLDPPNETWQRRAKVFCQVAQDVLWTEEGAGLRAFLHSRGLKDETIHYAGLGRQPAWQEYAPEEWGLESEKPIVLAPGLVIPGVVDGVYWGVQTRTFPDPAQPRMNPYMTVPGSSLPLYQADLLTPDQPAMLLESVLDALLVLQEARDLVSPVATFGTSGARHLHWQSYLAIPPVVLVSADADDGGDKAALFWLSHLPHARHWRPLVGDPTEMQAMGLGVREWVEESDRSRVVTGPSEVALPANSSATAPRLVSYNPSAPKVRLEGSQPQLKVISSRWQQLLQHLPVKWHKEEIAIAAAKAYCKAGEPTVAVTLYRWEQVPTHMRGSNLWEFMGAALSSDEESQRKTAKVLEWLALTGGVGQKNRA